MSKINLLIWCRNPDKNPSTTGGEMEGKPSLQYQAEWARDPTRNGLQPAAQ